MCCELDLYIKRLNDRGCGLFYLLIEMFSADWTVGVIVVFLPLFVVQPFHKDIIGQVLSTDEYCIQDLVQKLLSEVTPYIYLKWFKVLPITAFHLDAALKWYVILVLGDEGC